MSFGNKREGRLLWVLAACLTVGAALYQYFVGPTRPVYGRVSLGQDHIRYRLMRSTPAAGDEAVRIGKVGDGVSGLLVYHRYKTDDPWTAQPMRREGDRLVGYLPHQPPAGKVAYQIFLTASPGAARTFATLSEAAPPGATGLPEAGPVVIRFRGDVPFWILGPHVLLMFLGMLWSNRAGIEAMSPRGNPRRLALRSLGLLFLGGMIFGPVVQWYSFGKLWTGVPFGYDLTDNKTLLVVLGWVIALVVSWRLALRARSRGDVRLARGIDPWSLPGVRGLIVAAALLTLVVFSIPHSVLGSELQQGKASAPEVRP